MVGHLVEHQALAHRLGRGHCRRVCLRQWLVSGRASGARMSIDKWTRRLEQGCEMERLLRLLTIGSGSLFEGDGGRKRLGWSWQAFYIGGHIQGFSRKLSLLHCVRLSEI